MEVFPNPASSYIIISLNNEDEDLQFTGLQFTIYDFKGNKVFEKSASNKSFKINLENYPAGIYWITVSSEKKVLGAEKFVIFK